jgi:hypothetical protein
MVMACTAQLALAGKPSVKAAGGGNTIRVEQNGVVVTSVPYGTSFDIVATGIKASNRGCYRILGVKDGTCDNYGDLGWRETANTAACTGGTSLTCKWTLNTGSDISTQIGLGPWCFKLKYELPCTPSRFLGDTGLFYVE